MEKNRGDVELSVCYYCSSTEIYICTIFSSPFLPPLSTHQVRQFLPSNVLYLGIHLNVQNSMAETYIKPEINLLFNTTTGINTATAVVSFDFDCSQDFLIPGNEKYLRKSALLICIHYFDSRQVFSRKQEPYSINFQIMLL